MWKWPGPVHRRDGASLIILAGVDLLNNVNWAFALNTPTALFFSTGTSAGLTANWAASSPTGDSYTLQVSTDSGFNSAVTTSSNTVLTTSTITGLSVNTTYYGRVNAVIYGSSSSWTSNVTTATLANIPATAFPRGR